MPAYSPTSWITTSRSRPWSSSIRKMRWYWPTTSLPSTSGTASLAPSSRCWQWEWPLGRSPFVETACANSLCLYSAQDGAICSSIFSMSSSSAGSFSLIRMAAVVCLEKTTAKPLATPDSRRASSTRSVMSINCGPLSVRIMNVCERNFIMPFSFSGSHPTGHQAPPRLLPLRIELLRQFLQPCHHFVYRLVRRGRARRHPHALFPCQPGSVYLRRLLDLVRLHPRVGARLRQLPRVGAVAAADDDQQVALRCQLSRRVVPLVGLRAGGVHDPKLVYAADVVANEARDELREGLLALGRLGQQAHPAARDLDLRLRVEHPPTAAVHPGQHPPNLRMILLAVDYHLESVVAQGSRRLLRLPHDRAGGVDETEPALRRLVHYLGPASVRGDGDGATLDIVEPAGDADAPGGEAVHDHRVVNDRTQAIDWTALSGGLRHYVDRAANSEAEPQRFRSHYPHFGSSRRLPMMIPARTLPRAHHLPSGRPARRPEHLPRGQPAAARSALHRRGPAGRGPVSRQEQVAHGRALGRAQPADAGPGRERGVPLLDHQRPLDLGGARRWEQGLHLPSEQLDDLARRQIDELAGAAQRDVQVLAVPFLAPQLRLVEHPLERRVQERPELHLRHLTVVPQVHVDDGRSGDPPDSREERLLAQRLREER